MHFLIHIYWLLYKALTQIHLVWLALYRKYFTKLRHLPQSEHACTNCQTFSIKLKFPYFSLSDTNKSPSPIILRWESFQIGFQGNWQLQIRSTVCIYLPTQKEFHPLCKELCNKVLTPALILNASTKMFLLKLSLTYDFLCCPKAMLLYRDRKAWVLSDSVTEPIWTLFWTLHYL